jgi:hypothetical protein
MPAGWIRFFAGPEADDSRKDGSGGLDDVQQQPLDHNATRHTVTAKARPRILIPLMSLGNIAINLCVKAKRGLLSEVKAGRVRSRDAKRRACAKSVGRESRHRRLNQFHALRITENHQMVVMLTLRRHT